MLIFFVGEEIKLWYIGDKTSSGNGVCEDNRYQFTLSIYTCARISPYKE